MSIPSPLPAEARSLDAHTDPTDLMVGGRYQLEARIGLGGMGAVYRALDIQTQTRVAIKVLHAEFSEQQQYVKRFERESQAAARIRHPNIVRCVDVGRLKDGQFYLVLDFVRGQSLKAALTHGPISVSRAVGIARQVARALQAAHSAGVIHRDLKPENIMLSVDDRPSTGQSSTSTPLSSHAPVDDFVRILDFGIAKLDNSSTGSGPDTAPLTQFGSVFGTPEYMSPEQASGLSVDSRSDLYSAGVIFYEMVAGTTPFASDELLAVLSGHITRQPPALPSHVPEPLAAVIYQLLAKDPNQRFSTAEGLLAALDQLDRTSSADGLQLPPSSRSGGLTHTAPPGIVRPPWVQRTRGPLGLYGRGLGLWVAGCAIAALGAAMVLGYRGETSRNLAEMPPGMKFQAAAALGNLSAIERLQAVPQSARVATDWFALAQGYTVLNKKALAVSALSEALKADPELGASPQLRNVAWRVLTDDPAPPQPAAGAAISLAEDKLSPLGIDLLLAVASHPNASQALRGQALQAAVRHAAVAPVATQVALRVRAATSCAKLLALTDAIRADGDARAAQAIGEFEASTDCAAAHPCARCVSDSATLRAAKAEAAARPAPQGDWL